jgi:hypothetical protein
MSTRADHEHAYSRDGERQWNAPRPPFSSAGAVDRSAPVTTAPAQPRVPLIRPLRLPALPGPSGRPAPLAPLALQQPSSPTPVPEPHQLEEIFDVRDHPELSATGESVVATVSPSEAVPRAESPGASRALMRQVVRVQVAVAVLAMVAVPVILLQSGRTSALAFTVHGVGALAMLGLTTYAMHAGYPLLRGAVGKWSAFRSQLGALAVVAVLEAVSGGWLLHYYHAEAGAGHALSQSAPVVDQLAMNLKIYLGLASILFAIAAWWAARLVGERPGRNNVRIPALAMSASWIAMVCALALGLGISLIAPT